MNFFREIKHANVFQQIQGVIKSYEHDVLLKKCRWWYTLIDHPETVRRYLPCASSGPTRLSGSLLPHPRQPLISAFVTLYSASSQCVITDCLLVLSCTFTRHVPMWDAMSADENGGVPVGFWSGAEPLDCWGCWGYKLARKQQSPSTSAVVRYVDVCRADYTWFSVGPRLALAVIPFSD